MRPHALPALPALLLCAVLAAPAASAAEPTPEQRATAQRLLDAALGSATGWDRLAYVTDTYGARFSGTPALAAAYAWAAVEMKKDGFDDVRLEPVQVPRWVRGQESLELTAPFPGPLVLLGLGGSVATPPEGLEAELLVVKSREELDARAAEARGKIVLFDVPFTGYGETVRYRGAGASWAAQHGAVAMLLRSVGLPGLRTPHTGSLRYDDAQPKIPAAAIPVEDANRLARMAARGQQPRVRLKMEARFDGEAASANLVAEIRGREKPEEVVVVSGHFDSWDVGTGAMDDGGGSVAAWEAARLVKSLGLRPRRTLRVVLFSNEENGLRGGNAYRDAHQGEIHALLIESDSGVFAPRGFGLTGPDPLREQATAIVSLLTPVGATKLGPAGGGADIGPFARATGAATMGLEVDGSKYFLYHHTPADTLEALDAKDFASCTAALAVMSYLVADLP
ncbi:MAG: M20/M25/M40 family metallo-hydrolase [Vicinamibacteria bacterium]|nr:M20/M25/M40 family metallo-hydrolase [Vicinamibacteria bacterium]